MQALLVWIQHDTALFGVDFVTRHPLHFYRIPPKTLDSYL